MQFMCFRPLVFPAKEWDRVTISYSVKGRQCSWFVCTKTWSNRVSLTRFKETRRAWTFISAQGFLWCMALLMVIHAVCTFGCHAMLKAFEQTSNLWPRSHPSSQSTWIAGKSYCTSISFYHRITLLMCLVMCLCTTNLPLQKAWYTEGCLRVDTYVTKVHW